MCSNHLFLHQMFSKNYFWAKPLAVASCYCHLTSGSSELFLQDSTYPNSFSKVLSYCTKCTLFLPCYYLLKNLSNTTLVFKSLMLHFIQHITPSLSVWYQNINCIHAYMHTCLWLSLEIEYWLLDCLDWLDCEEEQGDYCDCCECASCYQGKWHTCPSPIFFLCISIFTTCSMHDRCFAQLFYQLLRS
jgi:hypothetical protein